MKTFNLIKRLWTDSREKQSPQRFARFAAMLIMLLTLGVGQMWAVTFTGGKIYFRNDVTNWSISNIQIFAHQSGYTWVSSSMSAVPNTKLYYVNASCNWGGFVSYRICGNSSAWGSGSFTDQSSSTKYTGANSSYGLNSGSIYLITPASSSNGCNITPAYYSSNSNFLKYTATAKVKTSTNGSSYTTVTSGTWPATVNIKGTYLSGDGATTRSDVATSSGASGTYDAVATGLITMTYSSLSSDYAFAGWGTGSTPSSTSESYAYNIGKATTVYAFFKKKHTVTFNANGHGSAPSSQTVVAGAKASTPTAPTATGYTFGGWYKEAECTNAWNFSSDVVTAATTLFAKWTENKSTITLVASPSGKGTFQVGGETVTSTQAGVTTTPSVTAVPISGYRFTGWSISGGATISSTTDNPTTVTGGGAGTAATLTATFVEDITYYTVTYAVGTGYTSLGSLSAKNTSTSAVIASGSSIISGTGVTFTATPNTGYVVEGWYTNAACTSGKHDAGSTTYSTTLSGNITVYVKFVEKTWSVAFAAGTGGSVTTPAATPQTVGQVTGISIAATPSTGYTFNRWTITSGSGSFTSAVTTNSNKFKPTAASTITASFNETKSTITVTTATSSQGTLKFGSTSKSWGTTASLGVATTQSITATAAAGFRFVRWDLTGAAASASSLTSATITLKADGSGSTGTATAVFEEDLSSPWIVAGGNKIVTSGTTWRTTADANNTMLKKTGHSTESVVYFTVPVTTVCSGDHNENFQFKIYNTSTSKWYGLFASGSYYLLKAEDGTEKSLVEDNQNIELRAYVTGNYEFKLDYSTSTPKLTVTWPVFNQVRISAASPTDATNTGNFDLSDPVSNVRSVKRSLNANTTYTFKIVYNSDFYGYNSGTFTRSTSTSSNSRTISTSGGDMTLTTDYAGDYTFKFNQSTKALSVDFPTAYKITFGKGSVDGTTGSFSAVDLDNGSSAVTSNSTWVKSGDKVKITAPSAKSGYRFLGWYDNNSATGDAITTLANCTITVNTTKTVYACYAENLTAITITTDGHGTIITPSPNSSPYSLGVTTGQAINASASTGYHWNTWTVSGTAALGTTATTASNTAKGNGTNGSTGTVTATFSPNTYTITLHEQGATTHGSPSDGGEITVTYDANTNLGSIASLPERTGYTFNGYYDNAACTGSWIIKTDKYFNWDGTYINSSTGVWKYDGDVDLYAKWVANQYTVTLDVDEANKGTIAGATTSQSIYYDDATVTVPNRPTAANGYALDGYYTEQLGAGTKVINGDGTWIASVEGYTDASKHWIHAGDVTLYAYYKKAEITAITLDATTVESKGTVSFAVTISPTPTGTTKTCFTVLHSNDNPLAEQPTITYNGGTGKYSFTAPEASGTYKVEAVLRTGSSCAGGTELDTEVASFQVAGTHTVTVRYKCGGEDIKAATALDGIRPLNWSDAIIAPNIIGYSFTGWSTGDGVSLTDDNGTTTKTSTTEADIKIKAIYDGYLTANYSKKRVIYFNNTLGWENVYVYFYKNGTYWDATYGTGCNTGYQYTDYPFSESLYGQMLPVEEGSKIYYFDAEAAGVNASYQTVVFTELDQHTYNWFSKTGNVKNKVIKRDDYYSTKLPMYVPLAVQTPDSKNGNAADYYWQGYWMNYPENTGYTLKIYNQKATDGAVELKSIPFEFTADKTMPMELDVDLEAGKTYGFKIYRNDGLNTGAGSFYGNTGTMTENAEGWDMKTTASSNAGLQTTAAGSYKFVLNFYEISSDYQYRVSVTYPVAVGDYRIVYTDGATWSGSAHTASWNHPSGVIAKNSSATETKKDTVSFFWSYGSSPAIGYQTCSSLSAGSASWSAKTAISVSGYSSVLTKTGVYNFIFEQPAGGASISLIKVEPYTGNYYIRTDVANSKWDNYRTDPDHVMTYSDYSIDHGGYSHYYCHWVQTDDRKNMKFVIANDYSPCISDTLIRETASGEWANIATYIESNGDIKRNANVRYMWNQSTNVISRAYIDGAQEVGSYFLEILSSDDKIRDPDDHTDLNQISFNDIENWVYEQNIQAQPGARIKLRSNWGTENTITQYFKGSSSATEQLIGGSDDTWYDIRVIYDFKTNRLIASYIPVDENITTEKAIEADIMFIREHQGDIAQLTFGENGRISKIETAYGVMRFNKWTLNNLSKTYPHNPLSSPASIYERSLFYISFPFRVKLSDVIGFGTYGVHWAVQRYDGAARAQKGHFQENGSFWKWMNRNTEYLEPNQGYLLAIDLDLLGRYSDIWGPTDGGGVERRSERLEIYFPSYGTMPDITNASVTCSIPEHPCTINWYEEGKVPGPDTGDPRTSYNRTIFDSHWNVMSVPTYVNTNAIAFANTSWVTTFGGPNFLYTWNANDNTIAATSATGFEYHAMHSYMVQYGGNVTWTARSGSPAGIVASKTYAEQPSKVEFRLELQQDSAMIDRTFVALSNDEETSAGFRFGEDLTKEFNANKANIYTFIADEATAAGNTLPMSDQTTIVPVGVDIKTNGDYTFTIPDGTSGIGVTLIDTETGIRTSLSALSYTVNLTAGTHDGRFLLEIAPIQQTPTDIDLINGENGENGVRKMLIDQQMYIIRDGKIYDARGARVQ